MSQGWSHGASSQTAHQLAHCQSVVLTNLPTEARILENQKEIVWQTCVTTQYKKRKTNKINKKPPLPFVRENLRRSFISKFYWYQHKSTIKEHLGKNERPAFFKFEGIQTWCSKAKAWNWTSGALNCMASCTSLLHRFTISGLLYNFQSNCE